MIEIGIDSELKIVADVYGHTYPIGTVVTVWDIYTNNRDGKSYMVVNGVKNRVILPEEFEVI